MSIDLDMPSHCARLLDTTIRAEWDAGHGADQPPDGAGARLSDAAWNNRAIRGAHGPTTNGAVPASQRAGDARLLRRLEATHERNRELATEIRQLREQLDHAHGRLRAARSTSAVAAPPDTGAGAS
jgi:hypothetical protein